MKRIVLILAIAMMGFGAYAQEAAESKTAPEIQFDEQLISNGTPVWDYGTIYKNGDGQSYFAFENTGKEPLILSNVRSSCGCTVPKWPRNPILPGQNDTIYVKYATNRLGVINKSITVYSNAKNSPVVLRIKGKVINPPQDAMPQKNQAAGSVD